MALDGARHAGRSLPRAQHDEPALRPRRQMGGQDARGIGDGDRAIEQPAKKDRLVHDARPT